MFRHANAPREGALEGDPVVEASNIVLTAPSAITAKSATVTGSHHLSISPSPILSALLGTLPEGLIVRARSGPGELPEPGSVALVGLGLMAFAIIRRRKALT